MEIPIMFAGERAGVLRVTESGLYTVLEAKLPGAGERLVRLWVHGGGKSAYLGLMQPEGGGLWLRRRLTRRELEAFPMPMEYASDREREERDDGEDGLHNDKPAAASVSEKTEETGASEKTNSLHNINMPEEAEPETAGESRTVTDHSACPWPAEPREEGLVWYRRPDGSLVSHDGISSLVALPAELRAGGNRAPLREIGGRKYLVFRY